MKNSDCRMQNDKCLRRCLIVLSAFILHSTFFVLPCFPMTQDDVFKSISENVSEGPATSGRTILAIVLGGIALIMLLVLFNSRSQREATPKALNHPGKLLKEIAAKIPLKPAELKQLKLLASAEREAGRPIDSPLIFILCPSALTTAMRSARVKVDRRVMAGVARKLGLITVKK